MKSLTWLLDCILQDCSIRCGTDTQRDYLTVSRRVKHEGISFLTITLPKFCSDFEKSLEQGFVDPTCFDGFSKHGVLPRFLGGLLGLVFELVDGKLMSEPSIDAILCIRQVCLMHKKILLPCSTARQKESLDGFVHCENELHWMEDPSTPYLIPNLWDYDAENLRRPTRSFGDGQPRLELLHQLSRSGRTESSRLLATFEKVSRVVWSEVLGELNSLVESQGLIPKHGPGATAEHIKGNRKYVHTRWHARLERFLPFEAYGLSSISPLVDPSFVWPQLIEPGAEQPVRVISVPKTLASTRIIAIEPVCMQYMQQALSSSMVRCIEKGRLTAGHINFRDQSVNRKLAFDSSMDHSYGTIDLSEASDRVHRNLVLLMLQAVPAVSSAVFACRSSRADLGDGRIVHLRKFASMGSALCFPIESMVFFTLCILSRLTTLSLSPSPANILHVSREVFVYGDDVIIPSDEVPAVSRDLEAFGLKVNGRKTFYRGSFRESCGMDAYGGVDVTPVYLRRALPTNRRHPSEIVSFVAFANQLYKKGWWRLARRVREYCESILGPLPHVLDTAPCLGWSSFRKTYSIQGWDKDLHNWKVKSWSLSSKEYHDPLSGYDALMKCFLMNENSSSPSPILVKDGTDEHLTSSVLRGGANIRRHWSRPY